MNNYIEIIQPDDWHVHFREGDMLEMVTNFSSRINNRCVAMPNTKIPITDTNKAILYKAQIKKASKNNFEPLVPCYLNDNLDLNNFRLGLKKKIFFGSKLYPTNATTNSKYGVSEISKVFKLLEILEEENCPLLIHGEKVAEHIDIFDREKYFIDDELDIIRNKFPLLKIVLEHVSTSYGVKYIKENSNIAGTITPHHMLLTKKDVFLEKKINPHHFCMPVVKDETDLIELRNALHLIQSKKKNKICHQSQVFFQLLVQ